MATTKRPPKAAGRVRQRYCEIRANNLEEILATCERHIQNIARTQMDLIEEGDGDETDTFYCNMFRDAWLDMRDDVRAILEAQKNGLVNAKAPRAGMLCVHVVACTEHEFGQRDCGHTAFLSEEAAVLWMRKTQAEDAKTAVQGQYFSYAYIGIKECSHPFMERLLNSGEKLGFNKLAELKGP